MILFFFSCLYNFCNRFLIHPFSGTPIPEVEENSSEEDLER